MQHADYPEVSDDFGHWLAGFIDGEGCFSITYNGGRGNHSMRCQFRIALRSDDTPLLEECQRVTGLGTVYQQAGRGTDNPSAMWHVAHKSDAARLIELLDRFALRSKKARDYMIWREGVRIRNSRSGGRGSRPDVELRARLEALRLRLMEGRKWRPHDSVLVLEVLEVHAVAPGDELALF